MHQYLTYQVFGSIPRLHLFGIFFIFNILDFLYLKWLNCNFHLKNRISTRFKVTWVELASPVQVWHPISNLVTVCQWAMWGHTFQSQLSMWQVVAQSCSKSCVSSIRVWTSEWNPHRDKTRIWTWGGGAKA